MNKPKKSLRVREITAWHSAGFFPHAGPHVRTHQCEHSLFIHVWTFGAGPQCGTRSADPHARTRQCECTFTRRQSYAKCHTTQTISRSGMVLLHPRVHERNICWRKFSNHLAKRKRISNWATKAMSHATVTVFARLRQCDDLSCIEPNANFFCDDTADDEIETQVIVRC